jgi:succinyl-diaminopimelate desuccinylase
MRGEVEHFVAENWEALVALCADLVAARSVNPPGDVRAPAAVLERFFAARGLPVLRLAAREEKPNLVVSLEGRAAGRHLVLNGHLDTIPPGDESRWSVPVYEMARRDGRLTGLGIGNMKAGLAALALAAVFLHENRHAWAGRLSFTAVADETVFGPDGAGWLLDRRPDLAGDALVCAEGPGFMNLGVAEKGLLWIRLEAGAAPGQGMLSRRGSGAVARLAQGIAAIDALNDLTAEPPAEISVLKDAAGEHGLRVSANCGTVSGGGLISQVATHAAADIDIRIPPGLTTADLESRIDCMVRDIADVSWRRIRNWEPNWTSPEADVCRAVSDAAAAVRGRPPAPVVRLPASDAARWRARGVPSICFGPQPTLAAGIDDYVKEADVIDCAKIYALAALDHLTAGPR